MKREDVSLMLEMATEGGPTTVPAPFLAALCRAWLALDGAASGSYEGLDSEAALIHFHDIDAPALSGQRVRIVPVEGEVVA